MSRIMNPRERVLVALSRNVPDKVPKDSGEILTIRDRVWDRIRGRDTLFITDKR